MNCRDCGTELTADKAFFDRCEACFWQWEAGRREFIDPAVVAKISKATKRIAEELVHDRYAGPDVFAKYDGDHGEIKIPYSKVIEDYCGLELKLEKEAASDSLRENMCGLSPFLTGKSDPFYESGACPNHDADFDELKASPEYKPGSITKTALKWAWAVLGTPLYLIIGGIGGMIRGNQLARPKVKQDPPQGDMN